MRRLGLKEKIVYSMGNLGISLITVIHMLFLVYFFFPPQQAGLPYLVPQTAFFMGLTILGIILSIGRVFDAVIDPILASISDNSTMKRGKRTPFMLIAALPFALAYLMPFFVPVPGAISPWNVLWLAVSMIIAPMCFTTYAIPFYSLLVEIAKTSEEKVNLGTISSSFWFVGFLIVSFSSSLWGPLEGLFGLSRMEAVRLTFCFVAFLGLICLLIPALYFKESEFVVKRTVRSRIPLLPSIKKVLSNKNFRYFLISNTGYTIATFMFESGLIFFITVLAVRETSLQGPLTTVIGALTLASYPLINFLSKSKGKKVVMQIGFLLFAATFIVIGFLGLWGINTWILLGAIVLLAPFSQAAFGILPQVVTADCAAYARHKSGEDQSAMYMAVNGMFVKFGAAVATIIFTSFLLLGKDIGDDLGIRVAVFFGAALAAIGVFVISKYDEKEITSYSREQSE